MARRDPLLLLRVCALPFESLSRDATAVGAARENAECDEDHRRNGERLAAALYRDAGPAARGADARDGRATLLRLRRDVHNARVPRRDDLDGARRAASPDTVHALDAWERSRAAVERSRATYVAAHAVSARAEWRGLGERLSHPLVAEGLRLASRALAAKVSAAFGTPFEDWNHRDRHAALKALAYGARFVTKTSPHGLFCATAIAGWGERNACDGNHQLAPLDYCLSVAEARKVTACLAADPAVEAAVVPRPNPTLQREGEHWTFWKPASPRDAADDDVRKRVRVHPVAACFLELAGQGRNVPALIAAVAARSGFADAAPELRAFYDRLVGHGLLIAEIEIPYAERRPLRWLAERVARSGLDPAWRAPAQAVEECVDSLAGRPPGARIEALAALEQALEALPHRRALHADELVRVDAASGFRVTLTRELLAEARRFLGWYAWCFSSIYPERMFAEGYARRFLAHHPADRDVSALDLYHGVFEPETTRREWGFPRPRGSSETARGAAGVFDRVRDALADAAARCVAEGRDEVALEGLDWDRLLPPSVAARWACGLLFQLARRTARAEHGQPVPRERLVVSAIYPGAGLAVARLAHLFRHDGNDPIGDELRGGHAAWERDGARAAELTYMHGARTANAGLRPALFTREIELPGDTPSPGAECIRLADLVVRYESGSRRFRLRSCVDGADVIPTLSSGISPEGFVSFLLAVGRQGCQPLSYYPGFESAGVRRWPRFVYGDTVVFRGRWEFAAGDLSFLAPSLPSVERFLAVTRWRLRHGVPELVFVSSAAQPKPFFADLASPAFVELFAHLSGARTLAAEDTVHFTEMLPGPEDAWVHDDAGHFASEFLVQLRSEDA